MTTYIREEFNTSNTSAKLREKIIVSRVCKGWILTDIESSDKMIAFCFRREIEGID